MRNLVRTLRALAREGLKVTKNENVYRVRGIATLDAPVAEILLPEGFPVESKALHQLAGFASVRHPDGGLVKKACATPDFHPGKGVPVGAVVATDKIVVPQAIGNDINCGMRLHVVDLDLDRFMSRKDELVSLLKGDLLLGTRDLPMTEAAMKGLFALGVYGWLEEVARHPMGQLARSDLRQLKEEQTRVYDGGSMEGDPCWAPEGLLREDVVRDGSMATVGGGNHFVEIQTVEQVLDGAAAYQLGVKKGQLAFMIHTGSRATGAYIGGRWVDRAKDLWPKDLKYPSSGVFPVAGEAVGQFLQAMSTAANYAYVNRLLLAELVRLRMREVFGNDLAAPLVYDLPHNIVLRESGLFIHRKGATPAHQGQPVIIPGSMGHPSFLLMGQGNTRFLSSASHGAGRAVNRFLMGRKHRLGEDLGLEGVECIALREERRIEEAPASYKEVGPVVDIQIREGIVSPLARMAPILTFKG